MGPRIGVAENRQNVRNQPPLSSALFYIHLVIKNFQKATEDRSQAGTAISPHAAILPVPTGKVNHPRHFSRRIRIPRSFL